MSRLALASLWLCLSTACATGMASRTDEEPPDGAGGSGDGAAGAPSGGSAGATSGGAAGKTSGGTAGTTSGGAAGKTSGGSAGATSGGAAGKTSGGSAGATNGGSAGATSGGTAGATSGGSAGATSGGGAGATSGGSAGATSGGSAGASGDAGQAGAGAGGDAGQAGAGAGGDAGQAGAGGGDAGQAGAAGEAGQAGAGGATGGGCGDGAVDPGEQCDDSNKNNGDGCSAKCEWESNCATGQSSNPRIPLACGDSHKDSFSGNFGDVENLCGKPYKYQDQIFVFTPTVSGKVTVSYIANGDPKDMSIFLMKGSCHSKLCVADSSAGADRHTLTFDAEVGVTYYIDLEAPSDQPGYTITLACQ